MRNIDPLSEVNESHLLGTAWVSTPQCHMAFAVRNRDTEIQYAVYTDKVT